MARSRKEDTKTKAERLQTILRLVQEHPISRQEVLLEHLRNEGFEVTQATVSRDIRELCLVKAATTEGYRYVSSRNESFNPKTQGRFETIFHESVLGVDYAGHVVLVKCYSGMANAACEVFDALQWKNVVGTLSGDDTFFILMRNEEDAAHDDAHLHTHVRALFDDVAHLGNDVEVEAEVLVARQRLAAEFGGPFPDREQTHPGRPLRRYPDAVIGVCGCYSQHAPEAVRALGVDIIGGSGGRRSIRPTWSSGWRTGGSSVRTGTMCDCPPCPAWCR